MSCRLLICFVIVGLRAGVALGQGEPGVDKARALREEALKLPPEQRLGALLKARAALGDAVNQVKSADPQAVVEAARIDVLLGKASALAAQSAEDGREAENLTGQADAYLTRAIKALGEVDKRLAKPRDKTAARLEGAQARMALAGLVPQTNIAGKRRRAELVGDARAVLEGVLKEAGKDGADPALLLARAWLVRCCKEGGDGVKAGVYLKELLAETREEAAPAQRLARAFFIQGIRLDKAGVAQVRKEADDWLKAYAAHKDSPEGAMVRFHLASALAVEAQGISKDPNHAEAAKLYDQAQVEFAAVALLDSELAGKADQFALNLRLLRLGDKTPLEKISDFDGCFLKGRLEMSRLQETSAKLAKAKDDGERQQLEAQRAGHIKEGVAAYEKALKLQGNGATPERVAEARFYLAYCLMASNEPAKALEASEQLARANPPTPRSAAAAAYALEVGAVLLARDKSPATRKRLRDLCAFVLNERATAWKGEPVLGSAHYQLAMLASGEKKIPEAIAEMEQVPPEFRNYLYARCQLAYLLLAARGQAASEAERQKLAERALQVVRELPELPARPDAETAALYFSTQIEAANLAFESAADALEAGQIAQATKAYAELEGRAGQLAGQLAKVESVLEDKTRAPLAQAVEQVKTLGQLGLARAEYRAGQWEKVLKQTGPAVEQLASAGKESKGLLKRADAAVAGDLLGLALRAQIQLGNVAEARQLMLLLRRLADEKTGEPVGAEVLTRAVGELKLQMADLRKAGDKAGLEATVTKFGAFLEAVGKDDPKLLADRQFLIFLGNCYAGVDRHAEAAKVFARVTEPRADPKKKATAAEQREVQEYWAVQATFARSLRLAKQFAEARKVLERQLRDPRATGKFQAEKELIHLLEDEGDYGRAITAWSEYLESPALRGPLTDPKTKASDLRYIKGLYFDGYYHFVYCQYKYGQTHKVDAKRKEYVGKAAALIVGLEMARDREAWEAIGPQLTALLAQEPLLRSAYEEQRKKGGG